MRKFGLIGYPLSHSFSQKFFTDKFQKEGIPDSIYQNFPLPSIEALSSLLRSEPSLSGLNVTIPYKEQVIPFLHGKNEVVEKTGACNCIAIKDGILYGYNTDTIGFERSLKKKLRSEHLHALILGTGGAAKAVEYVLQQLCIDYKLVSRNPDRSSGEIGYADIDASVMQSHTLIVNTTPVGMFPKTGECPPLPYQDITPHHYLFDLVYNPEETLFLQKGKERGATVANGYEMLVI